MATSAKISVATKSAIITKSTFSNYDACINPYVGCVFGCSYCYVRFFVKDPEKEWGEFVKLRLHLADKLPKELQKGYFRFADGKVDGKMTHKLMKVEDTRLVIGTMTDPYQPAEKTHRITRTALEILTAEGAPQFAKVGIFTRSPLVLQDIELIKKLPRARVHFTVTPFPAKILRAIEPYSPITESRWAVVKALKEAGIRTHVNVSPVIPQLSEEFIPDFVKKLVELEVDEYFVDPMQPYSDSFAAFKTACESQAVDWKKIEETMLDKDAYLFWKNGFYETWKREYAKYAGQAANQLPIWSDHENKTWIDMRTGLAMSKRKYGDDLEQDAIIGD